ncbi:hypothetical protein ACLUTX_12465 [Enterobacterales bacterium AE_CKDN230030158-1A_HGKHYDSX7]
MDVQELQARTKASVNCQKELLDFLHRVPVPLSEEEQREFQSLLTKAADAHSHWLDASHAPEADSIGSSDDMGHDFHVGVVPARKPPTSDL